MYYSWLKQSKYKDLPLFKNVKIKLIIINYYLNFLE